jgi:nicotinate-nucleotide adenylyltransferase
MRLGVLGGTFDPIHYGHLLAGEVTRVQLELDEVLFVPAGIPPHKLGQAITPANHRLAMVRLAIASNPYFAASTVDLDRPGPHYTVDTIALLRQEWGVGAEECYFIMGLDSLTELPTWRRPESLIRLCRLAVVQRSGYAIELDALDRVLPGISARVESVPMPSLEIASHDLQRRVREGLPIKYMVPEPVEEYIYEQRLYQDWRW